MGEAPAGAGVWVSAAEKALIESETKRLRSEERFARVFQSGLVAIAFTEMSSGRFIDVNVCGAEFFGYGRDEMVGRTARDLGLFVDPAARERLFAGLSATGSAARTEAAFRRKSGEIRHALVSMEAMTLAGIAEPLAGPPAGARDRASGP